MTPPLILLVAAIPLVAAVFILRVFVRRDYLRRGRLGPLSTALEYVMFALWGVATGFVMPSDWPAFHGGLLQGIPGGLGVGGGLLFMAVAMAGLGLRGTHGQGGEELRQQGLYAISRNPQLVGFSATVVGMLVLWPTWPVAVSVAVYAAIAHLMVLTEEEFLAARYGETYAEYRRRVPRYLGLPRRQS